MKRQLLCLVVFVLFLAPTALVSGTQTLGNDTSLFTNMLVRIYTNGASIQIPKNIEVIGGSPGKWIDIIIPKIRLQELSNARLTYSVLIEDVDQYSESFAGQYHSFAQIEQLLPKITALGRQFVFR